MNPGEMTEIGRNAECSLRELLDSPHEMWESLDVDYEPPHVERVWCTLMDLRVSLHRIHPCEKALYHPHPWPAWVRILTGNYEMGIAYGTDRENLHEVARTRLWSDSEYEMVHPHGWHYVRPIGGFSLSLMVTAPPWKGALPNEDFGGSADLGPLDQEDKLEILNAFRSLLGFGTPVP
jgi:hypothetical protein